MRILSILLVIAALNVQGAEFRDTILEKKCCEIIFSSLYYERNITQVSVAISENSTGAIKALLVLTPGSGEWIVNHDVVRDIRPAHDRAILYLCLLQIGAKPSDVFLSPSIYHDTVNGRTIRDRRWDYQGKEGPLCRLIDSDTGILFACETLFDCNIGTLAVNLRHAGAFLGDEDQTESDNTIYERYRNSRWKGTSVLGYDDYVSNMQMLIWMQGIATRGKMIMPRLSSEQPYKEIYSSFSRKDYIDSLRAALRLSVLHGMAKKANSSFVPVSGLTNISVEESTGEHTATFLGYTDQYTMCVIVRGGISINGDIPCSIAKNIIDYMVQEKDMRTVGTVERKKFHPAEKGR